MTRRDWFTVILLVPLVWFLDQASKGWAERSLSYLVFHGPLGLVLHHNQGAILGTFSDLPPILRVVSLSTGGAFLVTIYAAIQYLLPSRSLPLRSGMSLLLGGILGNVTDRISIGTVTDFLVIGTRSFSTPAFNFADAIQWVGYGLVVFGLFREGSVFWPDANIRKTIWVNPRFQIKYSLTLVATCACFAVVVGVFAYTFLKVTIDGLVIGPARLTEDRFLVPFLEVYAVITVGFLLTMMVLGRIISHRMAGPVYAIELYLRDLMQGKDRQFRLRRGDEFKNFEQLAEHLRPMILAAVALNGPAPIASETSEATDPPPPPKFLVSG